MKVVCKLLKTIVCIGLSFLGIVILFHLSHQRDEIQLFYCDIPNGHEILDVGGENVSLVNQI